MTGRQQERLLHYTIVNRMSWTKFQRFRRYFKTSKNVFFTMNWIRIGLMNNIYSHLLHALRVDILQHILMTLPGMMNEYTKHTALHHYQRKSCYLSESLDLKTIAILLLYHSLFHKYIISSHSLI